MSPSKCSSPDRPRLRTTALLIPFLAALLATVMPVTAPAQLVADGQTAILDGVTTNIASDVVIGTNGSFTLLELTNSAVVTNVGHTYIGLQPGANNNSLIVSGGSAWEWTSNFFLGYTGAMSRLLILDGGRVANRGAFLGAQDGSDGNIAIVSGTGSFWTNSLALNIGFRGSGNQLIISNSGVVVSDSASFGVGPLSGGNSAIVTGTGSVWRTSGLQVGSPSSPGGNQVVINNGGAVMNSEGCTIGSLSPGNRVLVTDPGTLFSNALGLAVGAYSNANQLIVSNGAVVAADTTIVDYQQGSSWNELIVTGPGSLLTNWNDFILGGSGASNRLFILDGGTLADNIGAIGLGPTKNGNIAVVSAGLWTNRSDFYVGNSAPSCQLIISNGGIVSAFHFSHVGYSVPSSNNVVMVSGTNGNSPSLWTNSSDLYFGHAGRSNRLIIADGGRVTSGFTYVGFQPSSTGNNISVSNAGSAWQVRGELTVRYGGRITVSDAGTVVPQNLTLAQTSETVIDGGNLFVGGVPGNPIVGGSAVIAGRLTLNSGTFSCQTLSDGGGQGEIIFNGGRLQTRFGPTIKPLFTIGNGSSPAVFEFLQDGSRQLFAGLVISSNATLTGLGTVIANVTNRSGGTLSPGASIGHIGVRGNLVLSPGSSTIMELNAAAGTSDKLINITNLTYGGALQLTNLAGTLTNGSSFPLFSAINYIGAFSTVTPPAPGPGLKWNTNGMNIDGVLRVFAVPASPAISGKISSTNLVVSAVNGAPGDPCALLTSTNLAAPLTDWMPLKTNYFTATGSTAFTNAISSNEPGRFFILQMQ